MKNTAIVILLGILVSSCSTVYRNGYYQTVNYKPKQTIKRNTSINRIKKEMKISYKPLILSKKYTISPVEFLHGSIEEIPGVDVISPVSYNDVPDNAKTIPLDLNSVVKNHNGNILSSINAESGGSLITDPDPPEPVIFPGAVFGFVLGILSLIPVYGIVAAIFAIVLCRRAMRRIQKEPDKFRGYKLAKAGLIMAIIGIFFGIIWLGIAIVSFSLL